MTQKNRIRLTAGIIVLFLVFVTTWGVVKNMKIRDELPDAPSDVDIPDPSEDREKERPEPSNAVGSDKLQDHPRNKIKRAAKNVGKLNETPGEDTLNRRGPGGLDLPTGLPGSTPSEQEELQTQKDNIQSAVIELKPKLKKCYEATLKDFPDAEGRVVLGFSIRADEDGEEGVVEMTEADPEKTTLFDQKLHDCMQLNVADIRVDAPKDGVLKVNYPFNFAPK